MESQPEQKPREKKPPRKKTGRSFFLRGLITILPAALTLVILVWAVRLVHDNIITPINASIYWTLERNALGWKVLGELGIDPLHENFLDPDALPEKLRKAYEGSEEITPEIWSAVQFHREAHLGFFRDLDDLAVDSDRLRSAVAAVVHPLVGVVVSLLVVLTLGYFTSGFIGRRAIALVDRTAQSIPVVRSVYPYTKQLVDFFASERNFDFDAVVAAPYPSENVWAIAFVTSSGLKTVHKSLGARYVSVFVPTSPMPMTGFTVFIREDRLIPLPLSVDEALRVTVSAGVLIPPEEKVDELNEALAALGAHLEGGRNPS